MDGETISFLSPHRLLFSNIYSHGTKVNKTGFTSHILCIIFMFLSHTKFDKYFICFLQYISPKGDEPLFPNSSSSSNSSLDGKKTIGGGGGGVRTRRRASRRWCVCISVAILVLGVFAAAGIYFGCKYSIKF
jgi:hypothetical protein